VIPIKKLDTRIAPGDGVAGKLRDTEGMEWNNTENVRWDFEVKSKESEGKEDILRSCTILQMQCNWAEHSLQFIGLNWNGSMLRREMTINQGHGNFNPLAGR